MFSGSDCESRTFFFDVSSLKTLRLTFLLLLNQLSPFPRQGEPHFQTSTSSLMVYLTSLQVNAKETETTSPTHLFVHFFIFSLCFVLLSKLTLLSPYFQTATAQCDLRVSLSFSSLFSKHRAEQEIDASLLVFFFSCPTIKDTCILAPGSDSVHNVSLLADPKKESRAH